MLRCRPPPTRLSSASPIDLTGPSTPPPLLFPLLFALHMGLLLPCHSLHTPSLGFLPKPEPLFQASQPTLLPPSSPGSFVPAPSLPVTVPCFRLHCLPARPRMGRLVRPPGCRAHASAPWSLWPLAMFLCQHGMKPPWSACPQLADRPHTLVPLELCRIRCTAQAGVGFPVWWWGGGTFGSSSESGSRRTPGELSASHQSTVMGLGLRSEAGLHSVPPPGQGSDDHSGPHWSFTSPCGRRGHSCASFLEGWRGSSSLSSGAVHPQWGDESGMGLPDRGMAGE